MNDFSLEEIEGEEERLDQNVLNLVEILNAFNCFEQT